MRPITPALLLALPFVLVASEAGAQLRPLVEPPASAASALERGVDVFFINEGRDAAPVAAPETIETIARDGTALTLSLIRSTADIAPVPAGGFARLRYRLAPRTPPQAPPVAMARAAAPETDFPDSRGQSAAILPRLRPYEPTYAAIGGDNAGAKLQLSAAVRPLAGTGPLSHLNVAYTQTIFWDVLEPSGPIRDLIYSPEVFIDAPIGDSAIAAIGYRHDSNGGGLADSVDSNRIYLRVNKRFSLGRDWQLNLAPQGWFYIGNHGIATDFERFYGYGAINASIEQRDGIKLSALAHGNPTTGKGGVEAFLSYPIARFGLPGAGLYLFGEAYTGYGERLRNYNRADTHARIGFSISR